MKFTQLLTHTSGPAKTAIQGLPIEAGSFQLGWNKLLRRYDGNNRRLYSYLEGFLQLPAVKKKSAELLSFLVGSAEELVKGLKKLGCPIQHFDVWFVYLIVRQLDQATKESWANTKKMLRVFLHMTPSPSS